MTDPNHFFWTHNLSPYIFHVADFNFDSLIQTPVLAALIVAIYGALWSFALYAKKRFEVGRPLFFLTTSEKLDYAKNTLGVLGVGFLIIFALNRMHVDWGMRWYSTMYLIAYGFGYAMFHRWIRKSYLMMTPEMLENLVMYTILGMLIGARAAYVFIYNWDQYSSHLGDVFKIWEGGLSFHGGLVGCIVSFTIFCRKYKVPLLHLLDKMAIVTAFGVGVGRIGNFMNGELYGRVIESPVPWAVVFPSGGPLPRHPSQLYQSFAEGWLIFLILFFLSKRPHREGTLFSLAIILYGILRFIVEYFREADEQLKYYFNNTTTMGQILCFITAGIGIAIFVLTRKNLLEGSEMWNKRKDAFFENSRREPNSTPVL